MTAASMSIPEARQQVHKIVRQDAPFDEKARDALELGRKCLNVANGLITQIDRETDYWEAEITTEMGDRKSDVELEQNLQQTYCCQTIRDEAPKALPDAPNQGWADDTVSEANEHHTYLGIPLILQEGLYGTVCFVAEEPRSEPFSDAEMRFAEHLTRLLERELERRHVEADLTRETNLSAVLNRVLRHNLRNDVSVIRGNLQQIAEQLPDEPAIETIFDNIDDLIDLGEKARELEQIVTSDINREPTAVGPLVEGVVETVAEEHSHASLSVEYDEDISAALRPEFERAIRELLENAIEHGGDSPMVSATIDAVPNAVEIQITDDGPGLDEMEAEVLTTGEETPLSHGQGLGLWLVHWIVTTHDGTVDTTVTDNGTTITLSIPRTSDIERNQQLPDATRGRDRFQAAFDEAKDAIFILDDDAKIVNINAAAETLFGFDWEEMIGKSVSEFTPEAFDFDAEWRDLQHYGTVDGMIRIVSADGVERTLEYSGKADIVPGEHILVGRDITTTELFNNTYQLTGLLDPDGIVLEANKPALDFGGIDREDVVGKPFWETHWWQIDTTTQQELQEAIDRATTGKSVQYEVEVQTDEDTAVIEFSIRPITDDRDNVTLLIVEGRDISERKERERELEEYETLTEALPDAVYVLDEEGRFTYAGDELVELVGYDRETIVGNTPSLFKDAATVEQAEHQLGRLLSSEGPDAVSFEVTIQSRDGDSTVCEDHMSVLPYEGDQFEGSVGTLRDITDRKERGRELQQTRDLMANMEELADVGAWEYDPDTETLVITGGFCRVYGLDPDTDLTLAEAFEFFHPDDRNRLRDRFDTCLETGEPYEVDVRLTTPDGGQRWVTARGERVTADGSGSVVWGYIQNITERTRREQEIEETNQLLSTLFDTLPVGVTVLDTDGSITRANQRAEDVLGLSKSDLTDRGYNDPEWEIFDEDGDPIADEELPFAQVMRTGEPVFDYEHGIKRSDSTDRWLSVNTAPMTTDDDEIKQVVSVVRDGTASRESAEAKTQNQRLEEFTSTVSHDLRSPLTVAEGHLELAQESCESPHLAHAADAIDRSQALIKNLLMLAREGKDVSKAEPAELADVATSSWQTVESQSATLETHATQTLQADQSRLTQLFENLYRNAIEHGGDDVTVSVGTMDDGFYVADTGSGIPESDREEVFNTEYSTSEEGTGLGLHIVKQVVEAHGWAIRVTDSNDDGARFEITGIESAE